MQYKFPINASKLEAILQILQTRNIGYSKNKGMQSSREGALLSTKENVVGKYLGKITNANTQNLKIRENPTGEDPSLHTVLDPPLKHYWRKPYDGQYSY